MRTHTKHSRTRSVTLMTSVLALTTLAGAASGSDRDEALTRLESAKQAFEAAKAELIAAQEEAAQYNTVATSSTTNTGSGTTQAQPESEEPKVPVKLAWNEGWEYSFNAGISGASGNTENFSGRVSLTGERKTEKMETSAHASYIYSTSDGEQSASRGELGIKNEWLLEGPWRYFADGLYEYDEFQSWQHRLSGHVGVGYEFINNDKTTLIGRAGIGGSWETGGDADETFIPEGSLGLDWTHQLSTNTKLKASTTYLPSFDDFGEFRWNNSAGIEVLIDEESGMTMNAGFEHRHDSDPGANKKPNDVDYYMGVGWKF